MRHQFGLNVSLIWLALNLLSPAPSLAENNNHTFIVGNPAQGKQKLLETVCLECHGADGLSISEFAPHLAGQYAEYIVKQVHNFQTGKRDNPTMDMMASTLVDDALYDIAAYFASAAPMKSDSPGGSPAAQKLYQNGDAERGIAACASCHGADGKGAASPDIVYPRLAGQKWTYLRDQIFNWKTGARSNSPNGIMNQMVAGLHNDEIVPLAQYISSLSAKQKQP